MMMLAWPKATEILGRDVTFLLENGFMMTLTLSMTLVVHISALQLLVKGMGDLILTMRSGSGSQVVVPCQGIYKYLLGW